VAGSAAGLAAGSVEYSIQRYTALYIIQLYSAIHYPYNDTTSIYLQPLSTTSIYNLYLSTTSIGSTCAT
jgi:hypothetical protein